VWPLKGIAIALAVFVVCLLFGARLLTLFRLRPASLGERALLAAGLGQVTVAYLILAIGLVHQLYLSRIAALLAVCLVVGAWEWRIVRDCVLRLRDRLRPARILSAWSLVYVLIAASFALSVIDCLAPPSFSDWDGLSHQLPVPAEFVRDHEIHYVPWSSHSNQPYTIQMFFALGLMLHSTDAAKLFHFVYGVMTFAGIWLLARRVVGGTTGTLAALAYCTMPLVGWLAGVAYVDLGVAFFAVLGLHFFLAWARDADGRAVWMAALCAGCGATIKMQGLLVWAILCGLVAARLAASATAAPGQSSAPRRWLASAWRLAAFAGLPLLIACPWYIKTAVYTGSPFYPFAYSIFDGRNYSAEDAEAYRLSQAAFGMPAPGHEPGTPGAKGGDVPSPRTLRNLLLLPWNMTMQPWYFNELAFRPPGRHAGAILWGSFGPAFLAFVPVCILALAIARPRPAALFWLLAFVGVFGLAMFYLMQYVRYLLPALVALCPIVAWPITLALGRRLSAGYVAVALLALTMFPALFLHWLYARDEVRVAIGLQSDEQYLAATCEVYPASRFLNTETPKSAKIGTYGEPRVFYIHRNVMWADPGHHEMIPYRNISTPEQLVRAYRAVGLNYLLLGGAFRWQAAEDAKLPPAKQNRFLRVLREARAKGYLETLPADWLKPYEVLRINYARAGL
jgi:4-amino-4-deoxy-L-arabinose transferase-like glycosyltransferase